MERNHNRRGGFALVEAMLLIMVFLIILTTLFSAVGFRNRAAIFRVRKLEAYCAAEVVLDMVSDEILHSDGWLIEEKQEIVLTFEPDDGSEIVAMPVVVWIEIMDGDLTLYVEAEVDGHRASLSRQLEMGVQVMSASSAVSEEEVLIYDVEE